MYSLEPFTGPLGRANARHLLARATFGPTQKQINDIALLTVDEAIDLLFIEGEAPLPPVDVATGADWVSPKPNEDNSNDSLLNEFYKTWHLELMRTGGVNVRERIVWFLHAHLPVSLSKVPWSVPVYYQNKLYRHYAFGNFKTMFTKLVMDNAMLWYLDNTLNQASDPNENFAREMLELYTIGKGPQIAPGDYTNYTEEDVRQAARVLTGYIVDFEFTNYDPDLLPDTVIAQGYVYTGNTELALLHDAGTKVFSDKFQNTEISPNEVVSGFATVDATKDELDQLMTMIFNQEETARFLVRKIYRLFVYYKISDDVEQDIIIPLAQTFIENDYSISEVLKRLFKSQHFYDMDSSSTSDNHIGAIIKSPVDLLMGLVKFFQIDFPTNLLNLYQLYAYDKLMSFLQIMGISFYYPSDVAGFSAYFQEPNYPRNWITSTNLAYRYYLVWPFLEGIKNDEGLVLAQLNMVEWVNNPENISDVADATVLVRELTDGLLATSLPDERFNYFLNTIFLQNFPLYYWTNEWANYVNTGDETTVKQLLDNLIWSLMQSPEVQLF